MRARKVLRVRVFVKANRHEAAQTACGQPLPERWRQSRNVQPHDCAPARPGRLQGYMQAPKSTFGESLDFFWRS